MRMATRRRRWIATGGATAAVAIGIWAAVALAAPGLSAPALTNNPTVSLSWSENGTPDPSSYSLSRTAGSCPPAGTPTPLLTNSAATSTTDAPGDGTWCYEVTGLYGGVPSSSSAPVRVDTTAPMVTIAAPTSTFVSGVVPISVMSSEAGPTVVTTTPPTPAGALTPTSWSTTAVSDGAYTINASVTDAAGNVGTAQRAVTVDNSPPTAFTARAAPSFPGSPQIFWDPSSDASGVTYRIVRNNGTSDTVISTPGIVSGWTDTPSPPIGAYTYTVQAVDGLGHVTSSNSLAVRVTSPSVTTVQNVTATSPTNATPHIAWDPPVSFLVTGYQVLRDGAVVKELDAGARSFDDVPAPGQGLHSYVVRAESGGTLGDPSAPVSIVYDTLPPSLAQPTATANPDGSVSLSWLPASDPTPGSGLSDYVVRRGSSTSPPTDPTGGTGICTAVTTATGCVDTNASSGSIYGYSIFAIDAAGNATRQSVSVRAFDAVPPDPVTGFTGTVGPTTVHLRWSTPNRQGNNADLAGYRIIKLAASIKQPTNPRDGTEVCPGLGARDNDCFVTNLTTGQKVTFAIYAEDAVPNFSAPTMITVTPNSSDHKKPGLPKKVRIKRVGAKITMTWVSPKDRDLSKFRVTLFNNGPASRPSRGKAVVTGRVLHASFTLKAGQVVYVNLFAIDLSGNWSRVTRLIVMPDKLFAPKSKHKKVVKKKSAGSKTAPKKPKKS
jgi:hypothetical protein